MQGRFREFSTFQRVAVELRHSMYEICCMALSWGNDSETCTIGVNPHSWPAESDVPELGTSPNAPFPVGIPSALMNSIFGRIRLFTFFEMRYTTACDMCPHG